MKRKRSREELKARQKLLEQGMSADLVDKALDSWLMLATQSPMFEVLEENPELQFWTRYGFMQGFIAGTALSVQHN